VLPPVPWPLENYALLTLPMYLLNLPLNPH